MVDPSNDNDPLDLEHDVGVEFDDEVPPAVAGNGPVAPLPAKPTGQLDADAAAVLSTQHESSRNLSREKLNTLTWSYFFPFHALHLNYICPPVFNLYSCFAGFLVTYKTVITI